MKRFAIVILVLAIVVAGVYAGYRYFHRRALVGRLALLDAELSYLANLQSALRKQPNPESQNSASVFVSANVLNQVLSGFDGLSVPLPRPSDATLTVKSFRSDFRDGFPGVLAEVLVTRRNSSMQFGATLYAVLEPKIDRIHPTTLLLYTRPLDLSVSLQPTTSSRDILTFGNTLLTDVASHYAEALPHITIPLTHEFSVIFSPTHVPVTVPTQAGRLNGEVDVPGLSLKSGFTISGILLLSDGIHVLLATNQQPQQISSYSSEPQNAGSRSSDASDSAIKQKQEQIRTLRAQIQPLTEPLKVQDSDLRIWVSKGLLSLVADVFNSLSPDERRLRYHTISEEGQLYKMGGGGAGCGGYAELVGGNSANATLQLSNLGAVWTNQGFSESADFDFSFDAQVTGHVNGPAGPHPTMVSNCVEVFHKKMCTDLPSVTVSCDTPVGGGVGLGSYGVHGNRTEKITATMSLHNDQSNWLLYDLAVTSPDQIPITLEVGLGQLGRLGIPISFGVPHQAIVSGKAPPMFIDSGSFEVPLTRTVKSYTLTVAPTKGIVAADGYSALGKVDVRWR